VVGAVDDLQRAVGADLLDDADVGEPIVEPAVAVHVPGVVEVDEIALLRNLVEVDLPVPFHVAEDGAHAVPVVGAAFRHQIDPGRQNMPRTKLERSVAKARPRTRTALLPRCARAVSRTASMSGASVSRS